jgi:pilus assembly protein FimV
LIKKSYRWQKTAIAAAAVTLLGLSASGVWALSLGRITVQSALGEPLRAEVDVPNISAEEASSLKANVAAPAAFIAAGLEYNAVMTGLQVTLARKADGRAFFRLTSDRPINDPFVDMILEASWSSGRIVRDYTMLFDPPALKQAAPAPTLAQTPVAASLPARASAPAYTPEPTRASAANKAPAPKPVAEAPTPKAEKKTPAPQTAGAQTVTVMPGDSASRIAVKSKAIDVSLDQMLVALLRANPDAFTNGNLNRLRAGAVLDLPSAEQAKSIATDEATQTVIAQSKDFNAFRRNLAAIAPKTAVEAPNRKDSGSVQAKVEDKKAGNALADKLTLSKGALKARADEEAKIARERAAQDAESRAAELAKNIADLSKLSSASSAPAAPAAAASEAKPALPAVEVAAAPPPVASAPAAAVAPASAPAKPMVAASAPVVAEPGLVDQLLEDPTLPLAGGGLLALLGGLAIYRRRQSKKNTAHVDSSFLESRLQPDSFFGASGGQNVDTAQDGAAGNSSLAGFSNSEMSAADDVDPVAEADVYLAYGRDMQAEEILKEALRHNPTRVAIHTKLLEIYAKRRDPANFLTTANTAFQLVGGESPEWARICEQGLTIDPENPLYQPGGASASAFVSMEYHNLVAAAAESEQSASPSAELPQGGTDLDLDLDFSADDTPALSEPAADPVQAGATVKMEAHQAEESNGLDFDLGGLDLPEPAPVEPPQATQDLPDLSLSMGDLELPAAQPEAAQALPDFEAPAPEVPKPVVPQAAPAKGDDGMLEFDLGSLSLDLGPTAESPADEDSVALGDHSLETKLALAEEFVSIGDDDGARALIEEVVAEATGELRDKAQRALANLS